MNVHLIQSQLFWENINQNILRFNWHLDRTEPNSLVVLPEMFSTGFTMNPKEIAEHMDGLSVTWMRERSVDRMICGSLAINEDGKFYNRFLALYKGEIVCQYDKNQLFSFGKEDRVYTEGKNSVQFEYQGWKIAPFICYDLRFPELIRQQAGAEIMIFSANWPKKRIAAWNSLLPARAIENQCYVIGVNRVGNDANDIEHNGCSQVIQYDGNYLLNPQKDNEVMATVYLEKEKLQKYRRLYPFLKDKK